jgi:dTDP-4-dehydrorhamnose reductase
MPTAPAPRRILVLGANGMLGHRVGLAGSAAPEVEVWATVRADEPGTARLPDAVVDPARLLGGLDAGADPAAVVDRLDQILDRARPDVVINAIGVVKQRPGGADPAVTDAVNGRFPHLVAARAAAVGATMIHLSTDCVFDGRRGGYREDDPVNATDAYGRSKAAGEPDGPGVLVLRTSMVGRELRGTAGLVEWFLAAPAPVPGYARARFSGLPTPVLADLIVDLARRPDPLTGLFHVAADPIDKASLLTLLAQHYRPGIDVVPLDEPVIDRTLDGRRFAAASGFAAPPWPAMIAALAADPHPYDRWRAA